MYGGYSVNIEDSCHCGKITFELDTQFRCPLFWCYCETCRKCNGSPVSMYIGCQREAFVFKRGEETVKTYEVRTNKRKFCGSCGSTILFTDSRWLEKVFPSASAIDGPLRTSKEYIHIFTKYKAPWFPIHTPGKKFDEYPDKGSWEYYAELGIPVDDISPHFSNED